MEWYEQQYDALQRKQQTRTGLGLRVPEALNTKPKASSPEPKNLAKKKVPKGLNMAFQGRDFEVSQFKKAFVDHASVRSWKVIPTGTQSRHQFGSSKLLHSMQ